MLRAPIALPESCAELLAWAESGELFHGPLMPPEQRWIVIHDQREAIKRSRGHDSTAELTWFDLRELISAEIPSAAERCGAYPEPYQRVSTELANRVDLLGSRLPERMRPFEHDISADFLEACLAILFKEARAILFYSMLLDAYRRGYFPCDWIGSYPKGRLVVFSQEDPSARETEEERR